MNQSIETIWKEGFVDNTKLVIPKVNDLYNKKSQNLIDKFHYLFDLNRKWIFWGSFLVLAVLSLVGAPILGAFMFLSLLTLLKFGESGMKKLSRIDKNTSSYEYLKSFVEWKMEVVALYSKVYSFFYPILFLAISVQFRFTSDGQSIIDGIIAGTPDVTLIFSTPNFIVYGVGIIAALLSLFAGPLYKMDLNIVYGKEFKKLDNLISDMEALRS